MIMPSGYNFISFALSQVTIICPVWSYKVLVLYVVANCSEKNTACVACAVGIGTMFIFSLIPTYRGPRWHSG